MQLRYRVIFYILFIIGETAVLPLKDGITIGFQPVLLPRNPAPPLRKTINGLIESSRESKPITQPIVSGKESDRLPKISVIPLPLIDTEEESREEESTKEGRGKEREKGWLAVKLHQTFTAGVNSA